MGSVAPIVLERQDGPGHKPSSNPELKFTSRSGGFRVEVVDGVGPLELRGRVGDESVEV